MASLLSGVALLIVGVGLLFSVVGLRAGLAEFSGLSLGLVMSAYFAGFVAGTYLCPHIIRRVGHIRTFAAMASVASTMPILHAFWVDPWYWGLLRFITGVCLVTLYVVVESWLNTLSTTSQRGKVFGIYMAINFVALAVGQWLILVGDRMGFVPFALVSVMFSFALLPITLTPVAQPEPVEAPRLSLRYLYSVSPLGVAGAAGSGLTNGAFLGLGAAYAYGVGFTDVGVASFMAVAILGGAVFQWPVGMFSDRHDRRVVMLWILVASAVVAALAFWFSRDVQWLVVVLGFLLGGFMFTIYGISVAHVNDMVDAKQVLETTGGLLLVHGIGAALGPTIAGLLIDMVGPEGLMLHMALVLALLALFAVRRIRATAPVPAEAKFDFVMMGTASPAVVQLAPEPSLAESVSDENQEPLSQPADAASNEPQVQPPEDQPRPSPPH